MAVGPTGRPAEIELKSKPILYTENGLRTASAEETLAGVERLIESGFFTDIVRKVHKGSELPYYVSWFVDPTDGLTREPHPGKGLSERQSKVSAALEGVERYCSKLHGNEEKITAAYRDLLPDAVDPTSFVLPADTTHRDSLSQEWVWGYSLTNRREVLVPASLVFCPYDTDPHEHRICDYNSNGLAAGNCMEEAILQGLLEVVERDAWMIMEYNRLTMPDIDISESVPSSIREVARHLSSSGIQLTVKNITTDIPIYTFGVFAEGEHDGDKAYAFAPGTHLFPGIALARSLTEAVQLYPQLAGNSPWLASGPTDHLCASGSRAEPFDSFGEPAISDVGACVGESVRILDNHGSEVFVVDLSRPGTHFPVVRVLCSELQPILNRTNPRFSKRLSRVPVELGYRDREPPAGYFEPRDLCGVM